MKKKIGAILLVVALALALALPAAPAAAHFESDPFVTVLVADGGSAATHVHVGTVTVWNDSEELHVKYETTDGWVMTRTHLEVALNETGIPQNRKGNPKVGQFSRSESHDTPVTEWEEVFNLDDKNWPPCTNLVIAAQAEVWDTSSTATMQVSSNVGDTVYGPIYSSAPVGDAAWPSSGTAVRARNYLGFPNNPITSTTVSTKTWSWGEGWNPTYNPDIPGVDWISTARDTENWWQDSWRWFRESFTVPGIPVSGAVAVNADNEYTAYANSVSIGSDNNIWNSLLTHPFTPVMGSNTLDFVTRNIAQGSQGNLEDQVKNPNGLTYLAEVEYYDREETAWGGWHDGERFTEPGNWATYFTYHVGWDLIGDWELEYVRAEPPWTGTHNMSITIQDFSDGSFSGTGQYPIGPMWNWTVEGTLDGDDVEMHIVYTDEPGPGGLPANTYFVDLTGTVVDESTMTGAATDYWDYEYTWTATRVP